MAEGVFGVVAGIIRQASGDSAGLRKDVLEKRHEEKGAISRQPKCCDGCLKRLLWQRCGYAAAWDSCSMSRRQADRQLKAAEGGCVSVGSEGDGGGGILGDV